MINKDAVKWFYKEFRGETISDEEAQEIVIALRGLGLITGIIGIVAAILQYEEIQKKKKDTRNI